MLKQWIAPLCLVGSVFLAGCDQGRHEQTERAIDDAESIDQENMAELMLAAGNPEEAVSYFTRAVEENPDRIVFRRGLAKSLARSGRADEAIPIWQEVIAHPDAELDDQVALADAYIRTNDWDKARDTLDQIPPTHETYQRYRLEAMVADSREEWDRADSFYEIAAELTARPAGVLNNWGYSRLTRGDHSGAERLFTDALRHDPTLFTAKNNLVLARAAQRNYELPMLQMTQTERAELLHTMALAAIRQDDVAVGRGLLEDAIETHPQHFEAAVLALRALQ
ncbi:MAG: Flp pilus assembly protein TadD [Rhodobacteraceae bacterium HLUCCA12]|nr:MAG: Flp pilus assembly protein TadD [Rhodobacteraceae bacterium HLUCCA12]